MTVNIENYIGRKSVWIGTKPVHVSEAIDLSSYPNYRAPSNLHGKFEVIWLFEREIFSVGNSWPLWIDESIRLLGEEGVLVCRTRDSHCGTLFSLKSMIFRNPSIKSDLISQEKAENGDVVTIFNIERLNFRCYSDDSWSIGILSNGSKSSNVIGLVEKIVSLASTRSLQIIIAGPENVNLPSHVIGSSEAWHDHLGDSLPRIGEKKNWIVKQAKFSNLAIFHDRYQLNDDFFEGFEVFGLDFDYASVRQNYESGKYYPSYIGFPYRKMLWQRPEFDKNYRTLHDGPFVNGGLIILKRHLACEINFNPLLLHNEAEDVELGFVLRDRGIVPRMNSSSSVVTFGVSDDYTGSFRDVSNKSEYPGVLNNVLQDVVFSLIRVIWERFLPEKVKFIARSSKIGIKLKKYLYSR